LELPGVLISVLEGLRPEHVKLAMLIPPLARAASRPGLQPSSLSLLLRPHPLYHSTRVFTSSPLHRKDVHGQRPTPGSQQALADTKAAKPANDPAKAKAKVEKSMDPLLGERNLSNKEQRKADWTIIKEMTKYLWPKDNYGTRFRVGLSVALLLSAKLLNVQVPFYFKSIVDSMNIDFAAVGGTATTVAGSMIMACKLHRTIRLCPHHNRD
jgi:ABC transporter ATM